MANEILFPASVVGNFKAIVAKGANVWNGSAMVANSAGAKIAGAIAMARQGTTLEYVANFPSGIANPGRYSILIVDALSPTGTEPAVAAADIDWNGVAENVADDASIRIKTDNLPATPANEATVAAVKAKTDNLPSTPANEATGAAIKLVTDKLGYMVSGTTPNYVFTGASLVNAPAAAGGGAITLDLTQTVPNGNSVGTVGEALEAARAQGFGKWIKNGTALTLYGSDGSTVVRSFTLDDANAPSSRS